MRKLTRRGSERRLHWVLLLLLLAALLAACGKPKPRVSNLPPAPDSCQITQAAKLSDGGDQGWSSEKNLLVFDQRDKNGIFQIWTMHPDGSDRNCLSCQEGPGMPPVDRHKFQPTWQPGTDWFVVQVELDKHPLSFMNSNDIFSEMLLNGVWNNLYAVTADGSRWVQLTDATSSKTDGNYSAGFSPDGKQLMWTQVQDQAGGNHPWGVWHLNIADFTFVDGTPRLTNIRNVTPPGTRFIEDPTFSPDGQSIVVSSDHDSTSRWQMDIWRIDLATGQATNITGHNGAWNEHATFTPDGKHIVFMTTGVFSGTVFQAELIMVDLDGSNWRQLTQFNTKGSIEYAGHKVMPIHTRWSQDGTQITETLQSGDHYPDRELWLVTFAGSCGGTAA